MSVLGRNTQGVRVIRTKDGESLVGVERIDEPAAEVEYEDETTKATRIGASASDIKEEEK